MDEINKWVCHFKNLIGDVEDIKLSYMGWKWDIAIWEAEPYHRIAQAMNIKSLKINYNGELFFKTRNVPEDYSGLEWSIRLLEDQIPTFVKNYGKYYDISPL